jgi:hypothetical protein
MKEDCVMKTMRQFSGKMITWIVLLLVSLLLHMRATSAQSTADTSMCIYQEIRDNVPINPMTNQPYKLNERNQEPFAKASIQKDEMKWCLKDGKTIKNHHIVFKELVEAWKEAVTLKAQDILHQKGIIAPTAEQIEQEKRWDISIKLHGGVLHTVTPYEYDEETNVSVGGIGLSESPDPMIKDASKLTEEERNAFRLTKKYGPIVFIRSEIEWVGVFMDSPIIK